MGKDGFGTMLYRCTHASGCLCGEFIAEIDFVCEEQAAELKSTNTLTCQRKSELLLYCGACGHRSWDHSSTPEAPNAAIAATDEWSAVLAHSECPVESETLDLLRGWLSVADAYVMMDESRVTLLRHLAVIGVSALRVRQRVVNALGKARRLAALEQARRVQAEAEACHMAPPS